MPFMLFIIIPLVLLVVILLISCISLVPQATAYVVEWLGVYNATWEAGLHFKVPFLMQVAKKVSQWGRPLWERAAFPTTAPWWAWPIRPSSRLSNPSCPTPSS